MYHEQNHTTKPIALLNPQRIIIAVVNRKQHTHTQKIEEFGPVVKVDWNIWSLQIDNYLVLSNMWKTCKSQVRGAIGCRAPGRENSMRIHD